MDKDIPRDLAVDEINHKYYKKLTESEISPFYKMQYSDVFLVAMTIGFYNKSRISLKRRILSVSTHALGDDGVWLIMSISVAEYGNIDILKEKQVFEIAEEYANSGITSLYNIIFGQEPGDSFKKLETQARKDYEKIVLEKEDKD